MDEVESARRRAAERGGAAGVRLLGVTRLRGSLGVGQLAGSRERGRGRRQGGEDGGRDGRQAAEPVGHRVGVQLDFCVVEILLAVTAVRVTVTPGDREKPTAVWVYLYW